MLAQNFKTPAEIELTDLEFESLVKVLGMLERGELAHGSFHQFLPGNYFNMEITIQRHDCGSVGCICGWARIVAGTEEIFHFGDLFSLRRNPELIELFMIKRLGANPPWFKHRHKVTPDQAAIALRSYLTTGKTNWAEAMAEDGASLTKGERHGN